MNQRTKQIIREQFAKEFGLRTVTSEEVSDHEITFLLKAIVTERLNPDHYSPAKWLESFVMFLRQTGKYPEMLESPRRFVRQIIHEMFWEVTNKKEIKQGLQDAHNYLCSTLGYLEGLCEDTPADAMAKAKDYARSALDVVHALLNAKFWTDSHDSR